MSRATCPLKLPRPVEEAARLAREDGVSLNQWIAAAVAQKVGAAETAAEFFARQAEGHDLAALNDVLTTTRALEREGLGAKTVVLDTRATGPVEITAMRELWAGLQNEALERAERERGLERGALDRVDHRRLEVQREAALGRGERERAEALERAPEVKLGPAANAMERRVMQEAEREGQEYEPVTERGRRVHEARALRERVVELHREVRERAELARERYALAREEGLGRDRRGAGGAAGRRPSGTGRGRSERGAEPEDLRERLQGGAGAEGGAGGGARGGAGAGP